MKRKIELLLNELYKIKTLDPKKQQQIEGLLNKYGEPDNKTEKQYKLYFELANNGFISIISGDYKYTDMHGHQITEEKIPGLFYINQKIINKFINKHKNNYPKYDDRIINLETLRETCKILIKPKNIKKLTETLEECNCDPELIRQTISPITLYELLKYLSKSKVQQDKKALNKIIETTCNPLYDQDYLENTKKLNNMLKTNGYTIIHSSPNNCPHLIHNGKTIIKPKYIIYGNNKKYKPNTKHFKKIIEFLHIKTRHTGKYKKIDYDFNLSDIHNYFKISKYFSHKMFRDLQTIFRKKRIPIKISIKEQQDQIRFYQI